MTSCVLGRYGFIGNAIATTLEKQGSTLIPFPTPDCDTIFYFGGTTHHVYEKAKIFGNSSVIHEFIWLLQFCEEHDIRLIWPSSALVYEKDIPFVHLKKAMEELQQAFQCSALGLRIFPTYGPGEGHKGQHASVIYTWCKEMKSGNSPVVFGDGTQTRDFIYIDDVANRAIQAASEETTGIVDVGAGHPVSFNEIITIIGEELGQSYSPHYLPAPPAYSHHATVCKTPLEPHTPLREGIRNILREI